ncbi:hypothetical protein BKA66DRAFT_422354, partial [Pyrenochaeta sp. MPI-SDFR-AT-0127]
IAEAVAFIYLNYIIYRDLTVGNIFLDKDLNTKVANFTSSSLDSSPLLITITLSY